MIEARTHRFWRATLALSLGSFMVFSNLYISQPLLPMLADNFQLSPVEAGLSFTIATFMLGLSLLFFGPVSDAIGRKSLMIGSMTGAVLCAALISQVSDYEHMIVLRAVQGFCLGGLPAIAIAYMGDEFAKPALTLAVGIYISANSLGGISGRLIGGFVGDWFGWADAFLFMAMFSLICLTIFVYWLPDSKNFQPAPLKFRTICCDLFGHLRNPLLLVPFLIGGFNFFIFVNQYTYATFLLSEEPWRLSSSWLGMLFLMYLSGTMGAAFSGRLSGLFPQPLIMAAGVCLIILGSGVMLTQSIGWIICGFLINAFGFFVAHSNVSSWVSHNAVSAKASASSLYLVFYYLGASTGGFYLGIFWRWSGWSGVIYGSWIILLITLSLSVWLYWYSRRQPFKSKRL
ncbi:MFS transporter [Endozoicomonas ascidiicola]|uniref:MFS transporter n=1 Tax=Endozoicomonas ascidiicola TaxID=1698521 RepID=UPI00082D9CBC|nr:MFS transporter [Endozoicomonas ascidiicola]